MRKVVLLLVFLFSTPADAQFRLPSLDINRLVDTVKNVGKAVQDIAEPEEIEIGQDVASRLLGAAPLVPNAGLQRYVNNVGRWLAAQTERPDLPWRFGVLDAPQLNAFAVPGGTIFNRIGDLPFWLAVGLGIFGSLIAARRPRRVA